VRHSHWPLHFIAPSSAAAVTVTANSKLKSGRPSTVATARVAKPTSEPNNDSSFCHSDRGESEHIVRALVNDPKLSSNLERHTSAALSRIYPGKVFEKLRPPWLRNPRTGRACELDFYNEELRLGLEVQGMQHYVYPNSWHKSRAEWEEQIYRDRLKEELCKQIGVTLVHVPFTVQQKDVEGFIRQEIERVSLSSSGLNG